VKTLEYQRKKGLNSNVLLRILTFIYFYCLIIILCNGHSISLTLFLLIFLPNNWLSSELTISACKQYRPTILLLVKTAFLKFEIFDHLYFSMFSHIWRSIKVDILSFLSKRCFATKTSKVRLLNHNFFIS
jgi:hypothetical protein